MKLMLGERQSLKPLYCALRQGPWRQNLGGAPPGNSTTLEDCWDALLVRVVCPVELLACQMIYRKLVTGQTGLE